MRDCHRRPRLLFLLASTAFLAACGGEDGPGTVPGLADLTNPGTPGTPGNPVIPGVTPPPPETLSVLSQFFVRSFDGFEAQAEALRTSARYAIQDRTYTFGVDGGGGTLDNAPSIKTFSLASARIEYAHAAGLSGAGTTVAVLDGGFRMTHETFANRVTLGGENLVPNDDHGTGVASVIAGDSARMIGVAPNARLIVGSFGTDESNTALTNSAIRANAVAINNSWGFPNFLATQDGFQNFAAQYPNYLEALRVYSRQGVSVYSVANELDQQTTTLLEALPAFVPGIEQSWIAVANGEVVYDDQTITSAKLVSAPCDTAARWCMAAEGTWLAANGQGNGTYALTHGTSFAAPMVSGAMALLQQAFPNLTPQQLRIRLLASADDDFAGFVPIGTVELAPGHQSAYSREFGHGFLDLRAALLPIGNTTTRMADGTQHSLSQPLAVTGGAVGDAVTRSLGSTTVLATDSFGGDFNVSAGTLVSRTAAVSAGSRLMASLPEGDGRGAVFSEYGGANLSLRAGETELSVLMPDGSAREKAGLSVGRNIPAGSGSIYLGLNVTQDDGRLLPVGPGGSTSRLAALEIGFEQDAGSAFWSMGGGIGVADVSDTGPLAPSSLTLNSLRAEVGQRNVFGEGDRLSLSLSMPMAVVSGSAQVALPKSRAAGGIVYDPVSIDFAPEAREVNLSLVYDREIAEGTDVVLGAIHSFNHGHVAGRTDSAAMVGLRLSF